VAGPIGESRRIGLLDRERRGVPKRALVQKVEALRRLGVTSLAYAFDHEVRGYMSSRPLYSDSYQIAAWYQLNTILL